MATEGTNLILTYKDAGGVSAKYTVSKYVKPNLTAQTALSLANTIVSKTRIFKHSFALLESAVLQKVTNTTLDVTGS